MKNWIKRSKRWKTYTCRKGLNIGAGAFVSNYRASDVGASEHCTSLHFSSIQYTSKGICHRLRSIPHTKFANNWKDQTLKMHPTFDPNGIDMYEHPWFVRLLASSVRNWLMISNQMNFDTTLHRKNRWNANRDELKLSKMSIVASFKMQNHLISISTMLQGRRGKHIVVTSQNNWFENLNTFQLVHK